MSAPLVTPLATPLATLDLERLDLEALDQAARSVGAFYLVGHQLNFEHVFEISNACLNLPIDDKRLLAQERSPAFRGWSEMRGARDCREQIHFGRELAPPPLDDDDDVGSDGDDDDQSWRRLDGPNQWPARLGESFSAEILTLIDRLSAVGRLLVDAAAQILELPPLGVSDPYLLLKLIRYPPADGFGVAPHCDFSLLTLLITDGPGLSVRDRAGRWQAAPPHDGALLVDIGELLEWASRGRWHAAPHRVENRSERSRLSLPLFVNPSLSEVVPGSAAPESNDDHGEHVHRVLSPSTRGPLHFGQAEWRRKGLNRWCHSPRCCPAISLPVRSSTEPA